MTTMTPTVTAPTDMAPPAIDPRHEIAYATPVPRSPPRAAAGWAIIFGGLGLVLLGGCFLIGVLLLVSQNFNGATGPKVLTVPEYGLMIVLYILAFASFAGAAAMLVVGTHALLRILRS